MNSLENKNTLQPIPRIAVIGVGQLGSRYVQGLLTSFNYFEIWVQDPSLDTLQAFNSWKSKYNLETGSHLLRLVSVHDNLPNHFEIIINATTANVRFKSLDIFLKDKTFDYLVLEKHLSTKLDDLLKLKKLVQKSQVCWVNHPMRIWPIYKSVKNEIKGLGPIQVAVKGTNFRVASSSSHYCDFVRWVTGEKLLTVKCDHIDRKWRRTKRPGFFEFYGTLQYEFSQGSTMELKSMRPNKQFPDQTLKMTIDTPKGRLIIDETARLISGNLIEKKFKTAILLQSEMTSDLVNEILQTGKCSLPTFDETYEDYSIFLTELLKYQKKFHLNFSKSVMIT